MWSSEGVVAGIRAAASIGQGKKARDAAASILMSAALALSACGFEPLYGERDAAQVPQKFDTIAVAPIEDRVGQEVRNRLLDLLTPKGVAERPTYRLVVDLESAKTPLLIQLDNTATRFNLRLNATFSLVDIASGKTVYGDHARSIASFNLTESEFATVAAERNAEDRAAREVSDQIALLLAVFFDRRGETRDSKPATAG